MKTTLVTTIQGESKEVLIDFTYYPPTRGARDSLGGKRGAGPPLEPDEPAEIEINSVKDLMDNEIDLTPSEQSNIESNLWDLISDNYE